MNQELLSRRAIDLTGADIYSMVKEAVKEQIKPLTERVSKSQAMEILGITNLSHFSTIQSKLAPGSEPKSSRTYSRELCEKYKKERYQR